MRTKFGGYSVYLALKVWLYQLLKGKKKSDEKEISI